MPQCLVQELRTSTSLGVVGGCMPGGASKIGDNKWQNKLLSTSLISLSSLMPSYSKTACNYWVLCFCSCLKKINCSEPDIHFHRGKGYQIHEVQFYTATVGSKPWQPKHRAFITQWSSLRSTEHPKLCLFLPFSTKSSVDCHSAGVMVHLFYNAPCFRCNLRYVKCCTSNFNIFLIDTFP